MKLELKHLAGYFPYDTVVFINNCKYKNIKPIHKLHAGQGIGGVNHLLTSNHYRIVLHPISDLTKEIEVNGENFVPLSVLQEKFRPSSRDLSVFIFKGQICIDIETEDYSQTIDLFDGYLIIQKLYEWHFDIHGLIENGLAIDINTLK